MEDEARIMFFKAINELLFTWGGDTPAEAIWTANDLLDFYEKITSKELGFRLDENPEENDDAYNKINELSK